MATDEVMKNYFARFIGHEMMFMVFSSDFHGIFTNLSFIVYVARNVKYCSNVAPSAKKCLRVLKMQNGAPNSKKCSKGAQRNRERPNTKP